MAASTKRICWGACAWIAYIQKERIRLRDGTIEDRYAMCRSVISAAEKDAYTIIISGLCFVEVCKNPSVLDKDEDVISAYFENDYILVVPLDTAVGTLARRLMQKKYSGLKPPDAAHLATALFANADELHTFDEDLLNLNGKVFRIDGMPLRICKPGLGGPPLPLLAAAEEAAAQSKDALDEVEIDFGSIGDEFLEAVKAEIAEDGAEDQPEGPAGTVPRSDA